MAAEIADGLGLEPDELAAVVSSVASSSSAPASSPAGPDMMARLYAMVEGLSLQVNTLKAEKAAAPVNEPGSPAQPGTPRELELQANMAELKQKQAEELATARAHVEAAQKRAAAIEKEQAEERAAAKAALIANIFCGCSKGTNVCGKGPCKCFTSGKGCTARCTGCHAFPAICCNDATTGVSARKKRQEDAVSPPSKAQLLAQLAAMEAEEKAIQSVNTRTALWRRCILLLFRFLTLPVGFYVLLCAGRSRYTAIDMLSSDTVRLIHERDQPRTRLLVSSLPSSKPSSKPSSSSSSSSLARSTLAKRFQQSKVQLKLKEVQAEDASTDFNRHVWLPFALAHPDQIPDDDMIIDDDLVQACLERQREKAYDETLSCIASLFH